MYRLLILPLCALVAACSQMSDLQRPSMPVPNQWPEKVEGPSPVDAAKIHWKAFFTDPRLQALIERALEHNRDLRIAVARVQEARAQFASARADQFPIVSVGPAAGTALSPGGVWPFTSVSYEFDFWGRIEGMTESARYAHLATEEARRAVQLTLVADVASAYFETLQANELLSIVGATVESRERSLDLIQKSIELGAANDYEYQQAYGVLESARASQAALEHQRTVARNRMDLLVGRVGVALPDGRPLDEQGLEAELAPGLPSEVLLLRPDVMAAEQRLRAAHANIGVARAALFPKVGLTAGLGSLGSGLMSVLEVSRATLQPVLSLPALFDGGRLEAGVEVAEARKAIAVAEYEKTILQAFREVADQMSARIALDRQMRATLATAVAQERRFQIAKARYELGVIGYLEVIDAQREQLASMQATTGVRRAQLEAKVQLYKVLGGGEPSAN